MDLDFIEKVKKLTVAALVDDEELMGELVLKGGNALNLVYNLSPRGSMDLDFSLSTDYLEAEKDNHPKTAGSIKAGRSVIS